MSNEQHSNRLNFPGASNKPGDANREHNASGEMQDMESPLPATDPGSREEREKRLDAEQDTERLRTERQSTMEGNNESGS